ncbi:hypothetical protein [Bradyrhizobium sp. SBR1B]|uniref:hypothetical protein n=1 Tax=Bradyrhizobium sp. SBR1B TaxID=2663836 RepID=UPI00160594EB|nr:hypothetical protein [Bradyrhizobium sp. SBR1B]MBB4383563.1 hypothetical protein [Bradyrhizobium sp. SBR1B]
MDRQNFDPSNVQVGSLAQHAVSEEPQTVPAGQVDFERHLVEASQAAPVASGHRATNHPHLPTKDGNFVDTAITRAHDAPKSRAAMRQRTLDLEEVVIYRQSGANAFSAERGGAPQVAATGVIVRGHSNERPLYLEDAAVLKLEDALIARGMKERGAHEHVSRLINYSRWLFENNLPSIVARLDSTSLIDDGATHKYTGGRNANLLKSLDHFRTFRATAELVVHAGRPNAERDSSSQSATLNPESSAQMEPRRIGGTAGSGGPGHPHLSTKDRNFIDSAMAQYAIQENPTPGTIRVYTQALRQLANDLRARGQTTDLADHEFLLNHATTYFSNNERIKAALSVLRRHATYPNLSTEDRRLIDSVMTEYAAQKKRKPKTVKRYTLALRELGNDFRARGQTTSLADHESLREHAIAHFPNNEHMPAAVRVLRTHFETYPHLSTEDRHHIDSAFAQYTAQKARKPRTVRRYTQTLRRLVNDLRARGRTINLADHESLLKHATTYFPKDRQIKAGLSILRAYHDPNHSVSRGRPRAPSSPKDASNDVQQSLGERPDARARSNLLPREAGLINHEHDIGDSRAAKRQRTLIEPPPRNVAFIKSAIMPSAVSDPPEEAQRLQNQLHDVPHGPRDNHPALSPSIDLEALTSPQFSPGEPRQMPDAETAEELQDPRDHRSPPPNFTQTQAAIDPDPLHEEQLRRVLDHWDDEAMPSAASVSSEELQRLQDQLHDELLGLGDNHPALSPSIDLEALTLPQFSPGEPRQMLDAETAEELQDPRDHRSPPPNFTQTQAAIDPDPLHEEQLRRVLDHWDDEAMPSAASVSPEELQRLQDQLHDELLGLGGSPALYAPPPRVMNDPPDIL